MRKNCLENCWPTREDAEGIEGKNCSSTTEDTEGTEGKNCLKISEMWIAKGAEAAKADCDLGTDAPGRQAVKVPL